MGAQKFLTIRCGIFWPFSGRLGKSKCSRGDGWFTSRLLLAAYKWETKVPSGCPSRSGQALNQGISTDVRGYGVWDMARILLAEDDESMRRFLGKALDSAGHEVISFGQGDLAYESLQHDVFDILLTDIVMPEMDGIELARRAAELDPTLKIMFITGFAAVALNPETETPKDAKVLSKPFHLRDLVNEVERLMAAA